MREQAIIQSADHRIGSRAALDWIFSRKNAVAITPDVLRRLHALAQGASSADAGEWKKRDNKIIEILPNAERSVRFIPVSLPRKRRHGGDVVPQVSRRQR